MNKIITIYEIGASILIIFMVSHSAQVTTATTSTSAINTPSIAPLAVNDANNGLLTGTNNWSSYQKSTALLEQGSSPAVTINSDGRLEVFVVGTDNQLYHKWQTVSGDASIYDNFNDGPYTLSDGEESPNRKWKVQYTGFGTVGVEQNANSIHLFEEPMTSTNEAETHASMVTTTKSYSDFDMTIDMKTVEQLRKNSPPNTWETAWIFWHYTDEFHYYALTLKTNGFQLEKKDNDLQDDSAEIYLLTLTDPKVKIGEWQKIRIRHQGDATPHIEIWVDENKVADYIDNKIPNSNAMSSGSMGLYNEDARVNFDNVMIQDLS
jgi:hypothetical protein